MIYGCIFYIFKNENVFSNFKVVFWIVDAFNEDSIQLHKKMLVFA